MVPLVNGVCLYSFSVLNNAIATASFNTLSPNTSEYNKGSVCMYTRVSVCVCVCVRVRVMECIRYECICMYVCMYARVSEYNNSGSTHTYVCRCVCVMYVRDGMYAFNLM